MTSTEHDIGSIDDFESGVPRAVEVERKSLVVVRNGHEFYAMRDVCPHAGARFSEGRVSGLAQGTRPDKPVEYCRRGEIITCPWHGWEFDLTTGQSIVHPDRVRVMVYNVRVVEERVIVEMR